MIINSGSLELLFTGFKLAFNNGVAAAPSHWKEVAMEVPSTTATEVYAWLADIPRIREWIGERVVKSLDQRGYAITNKLWENTLTIPRTKIEDDQYGIYAPLLAQMGRDEALHPDDLVFSLLSEGFSRPCYDGQYFFDIDHPVGDGVNRATVSVSNVQEGQGPAWFLLDCNQPIKPMIYQNRMGVRFTHLTEERDPNVFFKDDFVYGTRSRSNVGYGLWQLAFASTAPLNADNYAAARAAMQSQRSDTGRPLGINPTHLVVPPTLDRDARRLLVSTITPETVNVVGQNGGTTSATVAVANEWAGSAKLLMSQFLNPA